MIKTLIIGGSGVIGSKMVRYFLEKNMDVEYTYLNNILPYGKPNRLDITQESTIDLISKLNADVVVHTVALTNIDLCEINHPLADSINIEGTINIIKGCKISKSKLVYLSTSFVFDGTEKQNFEDDKVSPSTYYGSTKYKAEQLIRQSGLSHLILRTDQPYCWIEKWQHTNSVLRVLESLSLGKIHKEISDWYNTPTYVLDIALAISKLIDNNCKGIYHVVGPDFVSRYNWAIKIADIFGLNKNLIEPITSSTLNLPAKRVNVNLNNEKLFKDTGVQMRGIEKGLMNMVKTDHRS